MGHFNQWLVARRVRLPDDEKPVGVGEQGAELQALQKASAEFRRKFGPHENPYVKQFYPTFDELRAGASPYSLPAIAASLFARFFRDRRAA